MAGGGGPWGSGGGSGVAEKAAAVERGRDGFHGRRAFGRKRSVEYRTG